MCVVKNTMINIMDRSLPDVHEWLSSQKSTLQRDTEIEELQKSMGQILLFIYRNRCFKIWIGDRERMKIYQVFRGDYNGIIKIS